jgi:aryl-alcohol dehydrogenase-like predicted oxidoreductase
VERGHRPRASPLCPRRLDAVERLATIADDAGLTMVQLALGFVTAHPGVTSALVGPRTLAHLEAQLAAADTVLPADVLDAIDAVVAPGVDLAPHEKQDATPALLDASLRRR